MKKYNICEQCDLATDGCEKEGCDTFYPETLEEALVCPYCGEKTDEWEKLDDWGLFGSADYREFSGEINCGKCKNVITVSSVPFYKITAVPYNEDAVERIGHRDYREEDRNR